MSFRNPLSLFDMKGKVALITGASGAFGAVAARVLAGAGCALVRAAGNKAALDEIVREVEGMGAAVRGVNIRPDSEEACADLVRTVVEALGRLDVLVVASGMNKVAKIDEMAPDTFLSVMDANVTQSWLLARAATVQMSAFWRPRRSRFFR